MNSLHFAILGFVFEAVGLVVLIGRSQVQILETLTKKGMDGLDDWQRLLNADQRKKYTWSSVLIVVGISLWTSHGLIDTSGL